MRSRTYIFVGSTGGYFRNSVFKYLFIFLISGNTLNKIKLYNFPFLTFSYFLQYIFPPRHVFPVEPYSDIQT